MNGAAVEDNRRPGTLDDQISGAVEEIEPFASVEDESRSIGDELTDHLRVRSVVENSISSIAVRALGIPDFSVFEAGVSTIGVGRAIGTKGRIVTASEEGYAEVNEK